MGNRAVITTPDKKAGVYLHWNGGLESVLGFCRACRELGYWDPTTDPAYALGRLTYVVGLFFSDSTTSLGVGVLGDLDCDNDDNGVYVVGKDWKIVARYGSGRNQGRDERDLPAAGKTTAEAICAEIVAKAKSLVKKEA